MENADICKAHKQNLIFKAPQHPTRNPAGLSGKFEKGWPFRCIAP
jgi:hypothetical protein